MGRPKEFTVQHPNGDLYRVINMGEAKDAMNDARRATRDMRYPVAEWKLLCWSGETDAKISVRKLDEYEVRKLLDVLELNRRSAEEMERPKDGPSNRASK